MENQKIKKSAGRLSPTPMGDYDDTTTYRRLDWVYYGGTTYICKKNNTLGIKPSDPERWQKIIDEIGDMKIVFAEAEQLENITNGDKLSIIFGKIKKWFTHLNDIICRDNNDTKVTRIRADEGVQVSNRANDRHIPVYASDFVAGEGGTTGRSLANLKINDFTNYINVLTNINQITSIGFWKIGSIDSSYAQSIGIRAVDNVGDFYAIVANYNGDGVEHYYFGNLLLFSPRLGINYFTIQIWGEVATAKRMITHDNLLNTIEQISANTESFYAAGALAVKAMMADYNNKINQINSNMEHKLSNHGYYNAETSINDMTNPGIYRFYVNPNTDNANYLGWTARTLLICTGDCAGYMYQYFFSDWGHFVYRRNDIQGIITFDYNVLLRRFDAKNEIAELNNRIAALENLIKSNA